MYSQNPALSGTVTLGIGGNIVAGGSIAQAVYSNAPTFRGEFELGLPRFLALDLGIESALPEFSHYCTGVDYCSGKTRETATFLPFGVRIVPSLDNGRLEPFVGFGGAYVRHSDQNDPCCSFTGPNSWLWQANGGVRYALDHNRRFWIGTTVRYYRDGFHASQQQYISWTGDFSYRFGYRK
ncbi:MAG TPA: hypothetical protein VH325_08020 [Bryobacteraceae bacterium]|jgi:hypothetical protein|nr:hypothetical protein [Bryobacteraceae bacterium]